MGSSQVSVVGRSGPSEAAARRLAAIADLCAVAVVEVGHDGLVLTWNPAAEQVFGWSAADVLGGPDPTGPPGPEGAVERLRRDGRPVALHATSRPVTDGAGHVLSTVSVYATRTGVRPEALQQQLRDHLRRQQALASLSQLALHAGDVTTVLDVAVETVSLTLDLRMALLIRSRGDALDYAASYGWDPPPDRTPQPGPPVSVVLETNRPLVAPDVSLFPAPVRDLLLSLGIGSTALVPVGIGEHPWGALIAAAPAPDRFEEDDLHFLQAVANVVAAAVARDQAEQELRFRAGHDMLTRLPNRASLHDCLAAGDGGGALILADLDGFKDVNDSQGHQAGDRVLERVADRLRIWARPNDVVARVGGDEFAVLLAGVEDLAEATTRAHQLLAALKVPFGSPGGPVSFGANLGVAVEPPGAPSGRLLRHADAAMYRARQDRVGVVAYDPAHDVDPGERLARVNALRAAVAEGRITAAYQPVISLADDRVTAVEALARWNDPELGPQSPLEFVTLAEQSGLIGALTEAVLRTAVGQAAAWLEDGRDLPVAVNMSPVLLGSPGYADHLATTLAELGLPAHRLRIEVTESTLASENAVQTLGRIHALGARIAIDDFGTGYSSLGRIKQLPVQTVKIDRAFVQGICHDRRDVAIVRSVVALAADLGLNVVAEGVETAEIVAALQDLGVARGQGYFFSRPLPAAELEHWHDRWLAGERPGQP